MRVNNEANGRREKSEARKPEDWTTCRSIIRTMDKLEMKAQSVTASLIITTPHTAHRVNVFGGLLIIAHPERPDFLLTCRWAHSSDHKAMSVYVCVIIAHRDQPELLGTHTFLRRESEANEDSDLQPSTLLGAKTAYFHWQEPSLSPTVKESDL